MALKPPSLPQVDNEATNRAFKAIEVFARSVGNLSLLQGTPVEDITLDTGSTQVPHKLGRKPKGYIVTRKTTSAVIHDNGMTADFIVLIASATTNVNLWVF